MSINVTFLLHFFVRNKKVGFVSVWAACATAQVVQVQVAKLKINFDKTEIYAILRTGVQ